MIDTQQQYIKLYMSGCEPVPREGQVVPVFYMTPVMLYNQDELVTTIRKQKQIT
jgi:hypothetical protein